MTNLKKRVASHKILQFLQNNKVIFFFQKKSVQSDHWRLLKKKIAKIEGVATLNIKNKRDRKEIQPFILSRVFSGEKTSPVPHANLCFFKQKTPFAQNLQERSGVFCEAENKKNVHSLSDGEDVTAPFNGPSFFNQENTQTLGEKTCIYEKSSRQNLHLENENKCKTVERICDLLYGPNLILASDSLEKLVGLSYQLKEDSNLIFIGGWDGEQLINHLDSLKLLETSQNVWKEGLSCLSSGYARPYLFLYSLLEKRKRSLVYSLKEKMEALTRSLQETRARQVEKQ